MIMLAQNGTEWNNQGYSVGGTTTVGGRSAVTSTCVRLQLCAWLQQQNHLHYITMQISIGFSFYSSFLYYFAVRLCDGESMLPV